MSLFGFLNCDKPAGMTSRDVVNVVQRRLRKVKVGHAGTLDPMAEGVLVLGVGPAVRLVPFVQRYRKHYRGSFRLGVCSESGDTESELSEPSGLHVPSLAELRSAAPQLVGRIDANPTNLFRHSHRRQSGLTSEFGPGKCLTCQRVRSMFTRLR